MIYKAYLSDIKKLISLPETGIGYQLFEAIPFGSSYIRKYCAYNSEIILDLDNNFAYNKQQVFTKNYSAVLNEAKSLLIETSSIKILRKTQFLDTVKNLSLEVKMMSDSLKKEKHRYSNGNAAINNPKEYANGNETFVRISAYENDKRVDFLNRRLIDGSYTTTLNDYLECVSYIDDPVDRYALPNDEVIKWAFYILPTKVDILQRGIVQPAFGHQGGGIESFFEKGTSDNTLFDKRLYGK